MNNVLILGACGNFGKRIAFSLVKANISVIIAGRKKDKIIKLVQNLKKNHTNADIQFVVFDIYSDLTNQLKSIKPKVVINTVGPFQNATYLVAKACIATNVNYIDLADGRDFVVGIDVLNAKAKEAGVAVITGASTVPALSSAVLEKYKDNFLTIDSLIYGISPAQKTQRGLATTKSILTYVGKILKPIKNSNKVIYGWQNLYQQKYPEIGKRWMANCDIPDLDLFPQKYGIKNIKFSAGMELTVLHFGIWLLSWLVRLGLPVNLVKHASFLLNMSNLLDIFGTANGGMHMVIEGRDKNEDFCKIEWFLIAKDNDGPMIPTVPAIILTKKLISGELDYIGARSCVGMVSLDEYLAELKDLNIRTYEYITNCNK